MYVRKLDSGNWQAVVKHLGARRSVTRPTRRGAKEAGARLELVLAGQSGAIWQRPTVAEACEERLRTAAWSPTLAAQYRIAVARIPTRLANTHLEQVNVVNVEHAYNELLAAGVGAYGVRRIHELLRSTLAEAVRVGALTSSPMPAVRAPVKPPRQIRPPTPEQVRTILSALTGPARVAVVVAAHTGLRRGEVVALRWGDIDLAAGRISVTRSHAYTPTAGVHERPTKTGQKGQRVVSISADIVAMLRSWKVEQCESAIANMLGTPTWVVSDLAGSRPWRPDRLTHTFADTTRTLGLPGIRLHDLRHYVATQLLSAGIPVDRVAAMLGHTTTTTTEQTYRHWIPGEDADLADLLNHITQTG